jgi:hypothetical protein
VNAGVIKMESHKSDYHTGFRVPYINGKYWVPALFVSILTSLLLFRSEAFSNFFAFENFWHQIPMLSFLVLSFFMAIFSFLRNYSLIPVLGLCSNFYLMTELGLSNWIGFSIWLVIGLVVYFSFGVNNSVLRKVKV